MKTIEIVGESRTNVGKSAAKNIRREGKVPCTVYSGGKEPIYFQAPDLAFRDIIYTAECRKAALKVADRTIEALVKEVQFHPVTERILHIDFIELTPGKKVVTQIPIQLEGNSIGVKSGGTLIQKVRKVKVASTPEALTSTIPIDITELDLGKSVRVRDIKVGEGMEILSSASIPVASIDIPRALRSAQTAAAKSGKEEKKKK